MTIDFNTLPFQDFPNFKGGEGVMKSQMYWDGTTRILHAFLPVGASIGEHKHVGNCEMVFVLKGEGTIIDDGVASPAKAGQCLYCPEGHSHSLVNTGTETMEFYGVVPKQ